MTWVRWCFDQTSILQAPVCFFVFFFFLGSSSSYTAQDGVEEHKATRHSRKRGRKRESERVRCISRHMQSPILPTSHKLVNQPSNSLIYSTTRQTNTQNNKKERLKVRKERLINQSAKKKNVGHKEKRRLSLTKLDQTMAFSSHDCRSMQHHCCSTPCSDAIHAVS